MRAICSGTRLKPAAHAGPLHRLRENVCAEPAGHRGGQWLSEEQPKMCFAPGSRSFHGGWQAQAAARFPHGRHVLLPILLVEIGRQEEALLVPQHRIDAHHEITAGIVAA